MLTPAEARYVVEHARTPFPEFHQGNERWRVRGQTQDGRWLQVVFTFPKDGHVDPESLEPHELIEFSENRAKVVRVIHARDLTDDEKRQTRKRG